MHFNVRLEDERLCTLVLIGARADGQKELIAVEDGYRESAESWKTLLARYRPRSRNSRALEKARPGIGPPSIAKTRRPRETTPSPWRGVSIEGSRRQRPVFGFRISTSPIVLSPSASCSPPAATMRPLTTAA